MYNGKIISRIQPSEIDRIVKNVTVVMFSRINRDVYDFLSKFDRYYLNAEHSECLIFEASVDEVSEK